MKLLKRLLSYLPTRLPVGMTEFHTFSDSIIDLSGEYADRDSMKFAIATMILHLGNTTSSTPKNYFVKALRKTAANQVASAFFSDIKAKQQAAQKAAEAQQQKPSADTPSQNSAENGAESKKV